MQKLLTHLSDNQTQEANLLAMAAHLMPQQHKIGASVPTLVCQSSSNYNSSMALLMEAKAHP